ncbi:MAG TPA: hypothetical protein VFC56_09295 [Stellaceae bacterium]|nr:hypothetical protein [Stellaceae bacterium]
MAPTKFAVLPLLFFALSACAPATPTPTPRPVASVPVYEPPPKPHVVKHRPKAKPAQTAAGKSAETTVADAASQTQPQTKTIPDAGE